MKPADRARLTTALRDHVARVAEDLRAKMRSEGAVRERAKKLHTDEQVGEDFDVWTDLLARRAAVLWVLKSVYVRVLEDLGLLSPGRILDVEAQQLFEQLAPNLGETAFLRWLYRDLASAKGGLPELFSPQPAEIAAPSDDLSRELLAFWRHRDPDSGAHWSFAEEKFEGELMGDLYQELDPVVKDRFALCQTPDFVREFILDRTLSPAIETFGAEEVRLLDPACGSGHFLIDGLKRLVAATGEKHPEWDGKKLVTHCLERVVGIDLNDYACALARARLVMTAAELAGVKTLADASQFHPHVYWADGLEQVEKGKDTRGQQLDLLDPGKNETPRASLTRPEVRAALRTVLEPRFHALVANPPYILESDDARKAYHREKIGRRQRYVSAYKQYHLSSPFSERCFQLGVKGAFVGLIIDNQFMKRDYGRPLIEKVFASLDLSLVVDTSHAHIPFHGTPTVLLFARNRPASSDVAVRAVMGKRGEGKTPAVAANGLVWRSIVDSWETPGFDNEYVTVADLDRDTLGSYPWNLQGGGVVDLKEQLEREAVRRLSDVAKDIGRTNVCGEDPVFIMSPDAADRLRAGELVRPLAIGEVVRDWAIRPNEHVLYPYTELGGEAIAQDHPAVRAYFWRFRTLLRARSVFGKSPEERGGQWFEHLEHYSQRLRTPLSISFAFVATHNHFALDRGGTVFKQSAPVIKLTADADEGEHLALLAFLNSSLACFWMKQVFHPKTHASQRHHPDPARAVYEFTATGVQGLPLPPEGLNRRFAELGRHIDMAATASSECLGQKQLGEAVRRARSASELATAVVERWYQADRLRERMVAWQEEVDWTAYVAFGLADPSCLADEDRFSELSCPRGDRPFERIHPRTSTVRERKRALTLDEGEAPPVGSLTDWAEPLWVRRVEAISSSEALALIETSIFKRSWRDTDQNVAEPRFRTEMNRRDLQQWLATRIEEWARSRSTAFSFSHLVASLQDDAEMLRVAEVISERRDFALESILAGVLHGDAVPHHRFHVYTPSGLAKRKVWEEIWSIQLREDTGEKVDDVPVPPEYSQGSRGKSTDFLKTEYWKLRGKLDVPTERFVAFTEVPGRDGADTLYGWAGWTPLQRLKAILAIDEELEDGGVPLADRVALLDSAWRLLPDVAREDATAASRLKAELQALVGTDGPSKEMLDDWRDRFPPPGGRSSRKNGKATKKAAGRKKRSSKKKSEADGAEVQEES